jgi:hypothetical protein
MAQSRDPKDEYQAPALVELGSLEDLTQGGGKNITDGRGGAS